MSPYRFFFRVDSVYIDMHIVGNLDISVGRLSMHPAYDVAVQDSIYPSVGVIALMLNRVPAASGAILQCEPRAFGLKRDLKSAANGVTPPLVRFSRPLIGDEGSVRPFIAEMVVEKHFHHIKLRGSLLADVDEQQVRGHECEVVISGKPISLTKCGLKFDDQKNATLTLFNFDGQDLELSIEKSCASGEACFVGYCSSR